MLAQPLPLPLVTGKQPPDRPPEGGRMVHVRQMRDLVGGALVLCAVGIAERARRRARPPAVEAAPA